MFDPIRLEMGSATVPVALFGVSPNSMCSRFHSPCGASGRVLATRRRDANGSGRDDRAPHPSNASLRPRETRSSGVGIDRLDQSLDVAVTKSKSLEAAEIIRMTRHVIGT